jgi:hypothetical protein
MIVGVHDWIRTKYGDLDYIKDVQDMHDTFGTDQSIIEAEAYVVAKADSVEKLIEVGDVVKKSSGRKYIVEHYDSKLFSDVVVIWTPDEDDNLMIRWKEK